LNILIGIVAALGVVCLALTACFTVVNLRNSALAKDLTLTRNQNNNLMRENVQVHEDLEGTRATIKARDLEMAALHEEKTALQLEIEHLKSPDLATHPLQEAVQPERPVRKKRGAQ